MTQTIRITREVAAWTERELEKITPEWYQRLARRKATQWIARRLAPRLKIAVIHKPRFDGALLVQIMRGGVIVTSRFWTVAQIRSRD